MRLDRLMGILTLLLKNDKMTAPELAARFEVSRRTILRDIDALCLAGIPIATMRGGDGGIAIIDGYKVRSNVLTKDELGHLVSALKGLDSVGRQSEFERLMDKLAPGDAVVSLAESMVIDLSSYYKDSLSEKIALLKNAIAAKVGVSFDYYDQNGEARRELEPYFIEFRWGSWYVFGWCRLRQAFRRFKLNRLWHLVQTADAFTSRPVPPELSSGELAFADEKRMTIRFDKAARFRLIEAYGLDCYVETQDALIFTLTYTNEDYAFGWVLAFGDQAEVLDPADVRAAFASYAEKLYAMYHRT